MVSICPLNDINRSQWRGRRRRDNIQSTQVLEQKREGAFIATPINNTSPAPPKELRDSLFAEVFQSEFCLNHPITQSSDEPEFVPASDAAIALLHQQCSKTAQMWRKWASFQ